MDALRLFNCLLPLTERTLYLQLVAVWSLRSTQMSRSAVFGPNSLYSFTKFGSLNRHGTPPVSRRLKDLFRLENQKHMRNDATRERRYAFCVRCGITTVTVNFDAVPSARIGLWGRCANDSDYTHHSFTEISPTEYKKLREWPVEKRLHWWRYADGRG